MKQRESKNIIKRVWYFVNLWFAVVGKSLSKNIAYRFEFASKGFRTLMIIGTQLILIQTIYSGTQYVSGWSIYDYYLLLGIYNFVSYMSWGIFNVNLWRLEERVIKGEFDFFLLSPSGSIFMASFNEFFLDDAITALSGVVLIGFYIIKSPVDITIVGILGFLISLICAFIIWFSLHLAVASLNFVIPKNGLLELLKGFTRTASFPPDIFTQSIKIVLYTLFPIAFIAAVPARILIGLYSWEFVIYAIIASITSFFVAINIWRWSIRGYTSGGG